MDQERSLQGLSILIVEDEYIIARELKSVLIAHGAQNVCLSGQLTDAVKRVKDLDFDVALLDINIRGSFVYSVADELLRMGISIAFLTGYDRKELPNRFADVPLWAKPIDNRQLIAELCRLRGAHAVSRKL